MTTTRTFTKEQLDASRVAWTVGEFSAEWKPWRHLAAMQAGIIDPPDGTKWDSWGDDSPSERAILIRAIREQPDTLRRILTGGKVYTWSQVIRLLVQGRDHQAEDIDDREREAQWQRRRGPSPDEARVAMTRIRDTLGPIDATG
jgi:hypothetical protein